MYPPGLNGVAVTDASIGDVDGEAGRFHYRGRDAVQLAGTTASRRCGISLAVGHLPGDGELPRSNGDGR